MVVQKEKEFKRQVQVQQREEQLMQHKLAEQQQQQNMEVGFIFQLNTVRGPSLTPTHPL